MTGLSSKARERLLYLISPIGLIVVWQVLLMLGIGDRRFIPAPSAGTKSTASTSRPAFPRLFASERPASARSA